MSIRKWSGRGGSFLLIGHLLAAAARLQRRRLELGLLCVGASGFGFLLDDPRPHRVEHHLQTPLGVTQSLSTQTLPLALLALSLPVLLRQGVVPLPVQPPIETGTGSHIVQPIG